MDIEYVAQASDWAMLAERLKVAMADPPSYACAEKGEVVRQVAEARGVKPTSLRKSLDAASFLSKVAPEILEQRSKLPSMPKVLLVRAIYNLNASRGVEILSQDPVLARTESGLKAELRKLRISNSERPSREITQAETRSKAAEFEKTVLSYLRDFSAKLNISEVEEVNRDFKLKPPPDIMIRKDDGRSIVVEVKTAKQRIFPKDVYDILGACALWEKQGFGCWVVASPSWKKEMQDLCGLAKELKIHDLSVALFSQLEPSEARFEWIHKAD